MSDEIIESKKSGNGGYLVVIFILIVLLGVMAFLWSKKNTELNQAMNDNKALNSDMKGMNEMLSGYVGTMSNDLKTDFVNMLDTYDELLEQGALDADSLNEQKERIQNLIDELDHSKKMSAHRVFLLNKENETLRGIMKGYVYQIDSLQTSNYRLSSDLDSTQSALNTTQSERDQYKTEAEENAAQVKKGSKLNAYSFTSVGLKEKLNNSKTPTNKARNTVQIKSTFTISKNPITSAGTKNVYMQIIDPDGKILQSSSGNITEVDGKQIVYSDKKSIDYNNQSIDLSIYYSMRGQKASKGNYKINIYCQGQLIGSDSFTLK